MTFANGITLGEEGKLQSVTEVCGLKSLFQFHSTPDGKHELGIYEVLGDGWLLNRLSVLSQLRQAVLDLGYDFMPSQLIGGVHNVFPELELAEILEQKKIPFRPNASRIASLLLRTDLLHVDEDIICEGTNQNYLHHESAHCLYFELAWQARGDLRGQALANVFLESEAFAVGLEKLCALQSEMANDSSTVQFVQLNCYSKPPALRMLEKRRRTLLEPRASAGVFDLAITNTAGTLKMLAAGAYIAMLRPNAVAPKPGLAEWLLEWCELEAPVDVGELLVLLAFNLDYGFRTQTQRRFFRHLGLGQYLEAARSLPLSTSMDEAGTFKFTLGQCIEIVCAERDSGAPYARALHSATQAWRHLIPY